ncbi:MAG TPA: NAD-dependent epimerase/dehydratase family protein, partial [Gemmatimonadaceae bacterium]|nr:NAD-dependent epimerase/dehydratase family protein [Gemmatimonadaceae bacterium]
GAELHEGDVLDLPCVVAAARGRDAVFHAAAVVVARGGWEAYRTPNLEGTGNVITAAARAGARLLHVSSVAVYGSSARYALGPGGVDEDVPLAPLPRAAFYARSKRASEEAVLDAHRRGTLWATAIRPDVVYGPRDRQFVPRMARLLRAGVVPVVDGGTAILPVVHAANVADAAVRAVCTETAGGRAFLVANDYDVSAADFFRLAGTELGRPPRLLSLPLPLVRAGAGMVTALLRLAGLGGLAQMAGSSASFLSGGNPFTSERARRELGWAPPVHPRDGVPAAFRWWREQSSR